jgi:potassium uptake TrkH family protein
VRVQDSVGPTTRRPLDNPALVLVASFLGLILVGSVLLTLPLATDGPRLRWLDALFLSTSSVTVTGLLSFDAGELSLFGELVTIALVQIGGFGIMTIGTVIGLLTARRIGLRQRMLARTEIGSVEVGEVRRLVVAILRITLIIEGALAVVLVAAYLLDGEPVGASFYEGTFLAVSSFNNAGIVADASGPFPLAGDPLATLVTSVGIILGGLGFPVIVQLVRRVRPRHWSLHTRLVLLGTAGLLVIGPVVVGLFEWTNPDTLGPLEVPDKILAAWFQGVTPRTAGYATVDFAAMNEPTLLVVIALMFIGAAPASTGGGIRVTTFTLLGFVLWSVVRGDTEANAFRRRIPDAVVRQAIASVLLAIGAVVGATLLLLALTDFTLTPTLFETTSAFGTVGLSLGITGQLPVLAKLILMVLMVMGRIGPVTVVTALALRGRPRLYRYPEERPIVG